jgi:hypothetical protein
MFKLNVKTTKAALAAIHREQEVQIAHGGSGTMQFALGSALQRACQADYARAMKPATRKAKA